MYGVIFDFLRSYVIEKHGGEDTWRALLHANGYNYKIYFPVTEYPDSEIVNLAVTASKALDVPLPNVLEDFGSYVGHKLISFYHMYVSNENWKTFDIIENADGCIHHAVHKHNKLRKPPSVKAMRENNDLLVIRYYSERKMCYVLKGIVRGLGEVFNEAFHLEEVHCMHDGARECVIHVHRVHVGDVQVM